MVCEIPKNCQRQRIQNVLILVFVECGLWDKEELKKQGLVPVVLILVFVECGLWDLELDIIQLNELGLNPCFCGVWFVSFSDEFDGYKQNAS